MEQRVLNTRSVKTVGANGLESWTTVVLDSLHYESHLICTNCGPLGLRGDNVEPSTNRTALTDRSWAHIVHSAEDDDETGDVEFDLQTATDEVKQQVNRYRVNACLVAYVLIYIKHIPSCRPNLTYAHMLCNKWYDILWVEYNVPKPTKRKKIKLRMLLELFATESAVFEKFMLRESGLDFDDMRPDENGNLNPFCIEQLTDVVRSLQRCVDLEVIHNAWSHSLDHSPATTSHRFQMMSELAGIHGSIPDRVRMTGSPPAPKAPEPQAQGRRSDDDQDHGYDPGAIEDAERDHTAHFATSDEQGMPQFDEPLAPAQAQGRAAEPEEDEFDDDGLVRAVDEQQAMEQSRAPPPAASEAVMAVANQPRGEAPPPPPPPPPPHEHQRVQLTPEQQAAWNGRDNEPIVSAKSVNGDDANTTVTFARFMKDGLSREEAAAGAKELAERREIRCELSRRGLVKTLCENNGASQHQQVTKMLTDKCDKNTKAPLMRLPSTGHYISAERAAGACMPDTQEVMNHGYAAQFVRDVVSGSPSATFGSEHAMIGHSSLAKWEYKMRTTDGMNKPADYDFNWVRLKAFSSSNGADSSANVGGGQKVRSVWSSSAREIKKASATGDYSLINSKSMTLESVRDTLFQMAQSLAENKIRIPRHTSSHGRERLNKYSNMLSGTREFEDPTKPPGLVHPHCMLVNAGNSYTLDPAFQAAKGFDRPESSTAGASGYEKRLDYLVDKRALPSCILPESFEKGVPITECEGGNGIYFNKYVASEHASLKMESSKFLATVPGIAGGNFTEGPPSFKADRSGDKRVQVDVELDESRKEVEAKRRASASVAGSDTHRKRQKTGAAQPIEVEQEEASDAEFAEQSGSDAEEPPELGVGAGASSSDLSSVKQGVERPESEGDGVQPTAGAYDRAAGASVAPSLKQESIPSLWDQGAIFFSLKMAATLHNDCETYVDAVRAKYADVYKHEEREETLEKLPHITMRFPGITDPQAEEHPDPKKRKDDYWKAKLMAPLSSPIPLKESRYCDVGEQVQSARASTALTETVHSLAHGRAVAYNDPEVLEYEAEARGVNSGFVMEGNLFARSTWQRFTLSALDARGMRTPDEERRVNDQGLCMSHRVRNHMAAGGEDVRNVALDGCTLAKECTFAAMERNKRKRSDASNGAANGLESVAAQCRKQQAENDREVMEDALDNQFEV